MSIAAEEFYTLLFTNGPFAYSLDLSGGAPASVTEEQAEKIAITLHHRAEGAPPANG